MNQEAKSRWTSKDEAALNELVERKRRIMEENREPVRRALQRMATLISDVDEGVVDEFIANADAFRDALEPFDSGMRPS